MIKNTQEIKIQIYQVVTGSRRIKSLIFDNLKKGYKIEVFKITLDELKDIVDKKVHILLFDSTPLSEIKYSEIDSIQAKNKSLHTIVVTKKIDQISSTSLYQKHIDYICNASFDDKYIISFLKSILKRKSSKYFIPTNYEYKNILVDSVMRNIYIDNKLIDTSNKEFKLIKFLVKNNDLFISKQDIFQQIWGYEEDVSRSLDQYIHRIKKKIGNEVIVVTEKHKGIKMF